MKVTVRRVPNRFDPQSSEIEHVELEPGEQLERLRPLWFDRENERHSCILNGSRVEPGDWGQPLRQGSFVTFLAEPGVTVAVGNAVLAAAINAVTAATVSYAVSLAVRELIGPAKKETLRDDRSSPTYSFLGIESNYRAEGQPIPVLYGRHRMGGQNIQVETRVQSQPPVTTLKLLFSYGEGPIHAIGDKTEDGGPYSNDDPANPLPVGLEIDGQPAENYQGVRAWVRLGSNEQEAIPGFEETSVQFSVGNTMLPRPVSFSIAKVPGVYAQSAIDIQDWDDQGTLVSYTMGQEADELTITFSFPQGLFLTDDTDGTLQAAVVEAQVRYIEVDSGGTPISGAEYVILPVRTFFAELNSQFQWEVPVRFIDPDTYIPSIPGQFAVFGGSGHLQDTTPNTAQVPAQAPFQTEATMTCWARFDISVSPFSLGIFLGLEGSAAGTAQVLQSFLTGSSGFRYGVFYTESSDFFGSIPGLNFFSRKMGIEVVMGDGSSTQTFQTTGGQELAKAILGSYSTEAPQSAWVQLAFTYKADTAPDGAGRLRMYYNGVLADEFRVEPGFRPIWDSSADIIVGARTTGGAGRFRGDMDEALFFGRELSQSDLVNLYNGGQGVEATLTTPGVWTGYHFSTGAFLTDFVGTNALSTVGTAPTQGFGGPVYSGGNADDKKGRYKVEAIRLTPAPDDDTFAQDTFIWDTARLSSDQTFTYPNTPLLALEIKATDQLQGSEPRVSVPCSGRPVPIWNGADPVYPTFTRAYSTNPAWHAVDLILDKNYGLGEFYDETDIDVVAFKRVADTSDVYLSRGVGEVDCDTLSFAYTTFTGGANLTVTGVKALFPDPLFYATGDLFQITGLTGAANIDDYESAPTEAYTLEQVNDGSTTWQLVFTWPEGKAAPASTNYNGSQINSGTLAPVSRRFEFNGVFDTARADAWESLSTILKVARAVPIRVGGRISVFQDAAREPVALVTMANVIEGSFSESWSGFKDRPNIETIEYLDRGRNWERTYLEREADGPSSPAASNSYRRRRIFVPGITNREQAVRYARQDLNTFELSRYALTWEQSVDSLTYTAGDVVKFAHDVLTDTTSGRLRQNSATLREAYLDRPVVIELGGSYEVEIIDGASGTRQVNAVKISGIPGPFPHTVEVGDALPLFEDMQWTPAKGDVYTFGATGLSSRLVAIVDITEADSGDLNRKIRALEYNPAIYPTTTEALPVAAITGPTDAAMPQGAQVPDPVMAPEVTERSVVGHGGSVELSAAASWKMPSGLVGDSLVGKQQYAGSNRDGRLAIWMTRAGTEAWRQIAEAPLSESSMLLSGVQFERGVRYTLAFQSVSVGGVRMALEKAPKVQFTPSGSVRTPGAPTSISSRISGNLNVWTVSGKLDQFNSIELRRGGWILGQTVTASIPGSYELDPTSDWVEAKTNAVGEARPRIYARGRLGNGQVSEAIMGQEVGPPIATSPQQVWEVCEEDGAFTNGTIVDLAVEPAPTDAAYLPVIDRGAKLKLDRSLLEGSYTFGPPALAEAQTVWLQVLVDAYQVPDFTWDDMPPAGSREAQDISTEGYLRDPNPCRVIIEERHTESASFDGSELWTPYRAGRYFFRRIEIRVRATRPSVDSDVRIRRITGRAVKVNPRRIDHLAIQSFGR